MAEFTGIAIQTVAQGEDVAFTETQASATKCIVHRQGSSIVKLRGLTNQCRARFFGILFREHSNSYRWHS